MTERKQFDALQVAKNLVRGNSVATLNQIYQHQNSIPVRNRILNTAKSLQQPSIDLIDQQQQPNNDQPILLPASVNIHQRPSSARPFEPCLSSGMQLATGNQKLNIASQQARFLPTNVAPTNNQPLVSAQFHPSTRLEQQVVQQQQQQLKQQTTLPVTIINVARRHKKQNSDSYDSTSPYGSVAISNQQSQWVLQQQSHWSSDSDSCSSSHNISPSRRVLAATYGTSSARSASQLEVRSKSRSPSPCRTLASVSLVNQQQLSTGTDSTSPRHSVVSLASGSAGTSAANSPRRRMLPQIQPSSGQQQQTEKIMETVKQQRKLPQIPTAQMKQRPVVVQTIPTSGQLQAQNSSSSSGSSITTSPPTTAKAARISPTTTSTSMGKQQHRQLSSAGQQLRVQSFPMPSTINNTCLTETAQKSNPGEHLAGVSTSRATLRSRVSANSSGGSTDTPSPRSPLIRTLTATSSYQQPVYHQTARSKPPSTPSSSSSGSNQPGAGSGSGSGSCNNNNKSQLASGLDASRVGSRYFTFEPQATSAARVQQQQPPIAIRHQVTVGQQQQQQQEVSQLAPEATNFICYSPGGTQTATGARNGVSPAYGRDASIASAATTTPTNPECPLVSLDTSAAGGDWLLSTGQPSTRGRRLSSCGSGLRANFLMNKQHAISEFTPPRSFESSPSADWPENAKSHSQLAYLEKSNLSNLQQHQQQQHQVQQSSRHFGISQTASSLAAAESNQGKIIRGVATQAQTNKTNSGFQLSPTVGGPQYRRPSGAIFGLPPRAASANEATPIPNQSGLLTVRLQPSSASMMTVQSPSFGQQQQPFVNYAQESDCYESLFEPTSNIPANNQGLSASPAGIRTALSIDVYNCSDEPSASTVNYMNNQQQHQNNYLLHHQTSADRSQRTSLALPCARNRQPSNVSTNSMPVDAFSNYSMFPGLGQTSTRPPSGEQVSSNETNMTNMSGLTSSNSPRKFGAWVERIATSATSGEHPGRRAKSASQLEEQEFSNHSTRGSGAASFIERSNRRVQRVQNNCNEVKSSSSSVDSSSLVTLTGPDSSGSLNSSSYSLSSSSETENFNRKSKMKTNRSASDQLTLDDRLKLAEQSVSKLFRKVELSPRSQGCSSYAVSSSNEEQQQQQTSLDRATDQAEQDQEIIKTTTTTTTAYSNRKLHRKQRTGRGKQRDSNANNALTICTPSIARGGGDSHEFADDEQGDDLSLFLRSVDKQRLRQQKQVAAAAAVATNRLSQQSPGNSNGNSNKNKNKLERESLNNGGGSSNNNLEPDLRAKSALEGRSSGGNRTKLAAAKVVRRAMTLRSLVRSFSRRASSYEWTGTSTSTMNTTTPATTATTGSSSEIKRPINNANNDDDNRDFSHLLSVAQADSSKRRLRNSAEFSPIEPTNLNQTSVRKQAIQLFNSTRLRQHKSSSTEPDTSLVCANEPQLTNNSKQTGSSNKGLLKVQQESNEKGRTLSLSGRSWTEVATGSQRVGRTTETKEATTAPTTAEEFVEAPSKRLARMKSVITAVSKRLKPLRSMKSVGATRSPQRESSRLDCTTIVTNEYDC